MMKPERGWREAERPPTAAGRRKAGGRGALTAVLAAALALAAGVADAAITCARTVTADVVVLEQPTVFNRLGVQNPNWLMYALKRDVVHKTGAKAGQVCKLASGLDNGCTAGNVQLRPDKRTRPLALRVAEGDCLTVKFTNWMAAAPNPNNAPDPGGFLVLDDQVADRNAGFHAQGLEVVDSINSDGSYAGRNATKALVLPGQNITYRLFAPKEGVFSVGSYGATIGGEGSGGNQGMGLLGAVIVEPKAAKIYRSQVTEEEMRLAITGRTASGHPIINYEATYPNAAPWIAEGKATLPVLNMMKGTATAVEIVHNEINAIVAGPNADGTFPPSTYPLESVGKRNPVYPNRLEPFRDFASIFHDDQAAAQAFPLWYNDPILRHTLIGVSDKFMINYGSGGIGSEIIANRLHTGPMHDCADCAYEEFFLASQAVADPAALVNFPANTGIEGCDPRAIAGPSCWRDKINLANGPIAGNFALFSEDPSNVHHGYTGDFAKIRNAHAALREQHIFHLHNTQWVFNPNDDNSNYLDAQEIMPGSGHTYELTYGGVGNRNKTAGDAIFHCHFYPHFAEGMWYHIRNHDVLELGTVLAVSGGTPTAPGFHGAAWALRSGKPAAGARALPDPELPEGSPIPAIVPLPGKAMPPLPARVSIVAVDRGDWSVTTGRTPPNALGQGPDSGQALINPTDLAAGKNPGFPFWVAGNECGTPTATDPCPLGIVGNRGPTPVLDMLTEAGAQAAGYNPKTAGGFDGGLPRHALRGYTSGAVTLDTQNRLSFSKVMERAQPVFFPELGTAAEKAAMNFHATRQHATAKANLNGTSAAASFVTNGAPPVPGGPFQDPCIDDTGKPMTAANGLGSFFDGNLVLPGSPESLSIKGRSAFTSDNPRTYAISNVQIDAVFNKVGYHYPQERIIAIWGDVLDLINKRKPPEPLVMRFASFDCGKILHTNLIPAEFELDDFQVRTPTDIIGQHIHLPKWDLTTNDGAANGWNYEDGTLSPGAVRERIHAINLWNEDAAAGRIPGLAPVPTLTVAQGADPGAASAKGVTHLTPLPHPFFGAGEPIQTAAGLEEEWLGARTTIQRIFQDPVVNVGGIDRGLGQTFSHDHYGPSTFQQLGLYSTIMAEPANSLWVHNETGVALHTTASGTPARTVTGPGGLTIADGGPTSWQAAILPQAQLAGVNTKGAPCAAGQIDQVDCIEPHREFYFEFSDFQHAYEAGFYVGADSRGKPIRTQVLQPDPFNAAVATAPALRNTWLQAVNPVSKVMKQPFPDVVHALDTCVLAPRAGLTGDVAPVRPCPEAINVGHSSMWVTNYRNEPIALRVFDPTKVGPDGKRGMQADGLPGDLAFALQTRTDRKIAALNTSLGNTPYPAVGSGDEINRDRRAGDPFTPIMRTYEGDRVKMKIQSGATEEQHQVSMHGVKWLSTGSGFGKAGNSGWRNFQSSGISEQFSLQIPMNANLGQNGVNADYLYATDVTRDGWWTGVWGVLRNYGGAQGDLFQLPNNPQTGRELIVNGIGFANIAGNRVCPIGATQRTYNISAVLANAVLGNALGATIPANTAPVDNVGGPLNPAGGTLVYNRRGTVVPAQTVIADNGAQVILPGGTGPLHDPTAMMYVRDEDLLGSGRLRNGAPVEPLVLRANAGDCIVVNLTNRLPAVAPDLAGWQDVMWVVNRDLFQPVAARNQQEMVFFNNNLIRPSSHVGLTPQLVEYDITRSDGVNVGTNPVQTAAPGTTKTYVWYAGDLKHDMVLQLGDIRAVTINATPVEFGGSNLMPADKIKQGQKALYGSLVVEPAAATITETTQVADRQGTGAATRLTRANVTVTSAAGPAGSGGTFREAVLVTAKTASFRWKDGTAVRNFNQGEIGVEGAEDAHAAVLNYGTEPAWFRFKLPPDAPFGNAGTPNTLGSLPNAHQYYSNSLVAAEPNTLPLGDPATPVFTAPRGQPARIHVVTPSSTDRDSVFHLHGHVWQRDPFICTGARRAQTSVTGTAAQDPQDAAVPLAGRCAPSARVPSNALGLNPQGKWMAAEEGWGHQFGHWPVLLQSAGGGNAVIGDYLFRDWGNFGNNIGMWGIFRVQ